MNNSYSYIYSLSDPNTGETRYVGKSVDPEGRLRLHIRDRKSSGTYCASWIKSLSNSGLFPKVNILEKCVGAEWQGKEIGWIARLRAAGCRLTNITAGGEGIKKGFKNRAEVICRWVEAAYKRSPLSIETREKISKSKVGKPRPPEMCRRISEKLSGRKLSKEHREAIGDGQRGKPWSLKRKNAVVDRSFFKSPEYIDKLRAASTGKKRSQETCARISKSKAGKKWSKETRAAVMAGRLAAKKSKRKEK